MSRLLAVAVSLALCACTGAPWSPESPPVPGLPTFVVEVSLGGQAVSALVRALPEEQAHGLMDRREPLTDHEGMLFAFAEDRKHSFWMKDTYVPLDMVFLGTDGVVVGCLANVPPRSEQSRAIGQPSRYVLEVNAGFCARYGVISGQAARIGPPKRALGPAS